MKGNSTIKKYIIELWPLISPYKWSFLNLFICVIVTSIIGMLYPYIFGLLVDEVFYHRNMLFFKIIVIGYAVVFLSETGLHLVLNSVWTYLTTRFTFDLRKRIYVKVLSLKASYFHHMQSGDLVTVINKDADEVMNLIHWNIFYVMANCIRLITAITFVMLINVTMGVLMLVVVPLSVFTAMQFGKIIKKRLNEQRNEYGRWMSWSMEILSGLRDIRLLAAQNQMTRKFMQFCTRLIRIKNRTSKIELLSERSISFISLCSNLVVYILAGWFVIQGDLTVGGFIALMEYFSRANGLLQSLSGANSRLQGNKVSIERIFHILQEEGEVQYVDAKPLVITKGDITFNQVSFYYNENVPVLSKLNLSVSGGETVAIVGRSGAGKTTLLSLLLRFYEPNSGDVKIDGVPIQECDFKSLRKQIGFVLQEPIIFEGTIRSNLLWGNSKKSDAELWEACRKASIAEYILSTPLGLDTVVGGAGLSMSGGQKQRVAIARIFLKQPRMLIFDEATSALDLESERAVKSAWKQLQLSGNVTTLIVAHRLSTILAADRVAVLDKGEIVAYGHHDDLLKESELYRKLFYDQYASHKEASSE